VLWRILWVRLFLLLLLLLLLLLSLEKSLLRMGRRARKICSRWRLQMQALLWRKLRRLLGWQLLQLRSSRPRLRCWRGWCAGGSTCRIKG